MPENEVSLTARIFLHNSKCGALHVSTAIAGHKLFIRSGSDFRDSCYFTVFIWSLSDNNILEKKTSQHNSSGHFFNSRRRFGKISRSDNRRLPFVVKACSIGLLDFFTAIQKFDEVTFDSTLNADVWTEDVPETPPPCYEKAIEMTTLALLTAAANQVDTYSSEQYAFTQETMDTSDKLFV